MISYIDYNQEYWLDSAAAEYEAKGLKVDFLPFTYGADFLPLTGFTTDRTTWVVDHDSDFLITHQTGATFLANGGILIEANVKVRLQLATSQRDLMNTPQPFLSIFGTGERPHILYKPLLMPAKTAMLVELSNVSGQSVDVRLSFMGVKVFLRGK